MARRRTDVPARPGVLRCAVYTRKSSEEGLEQEFNSLHAQREACEAFIRSQKHEGWVCQPDAYDDGGISGGTMERPALQRLLVDIQQGKVQVVVVYKVDRLTRSLADFAKMVEVFDAHGVSFVSVTQQFNTTSSMGRLTLNVLLSFAQFEREVTGERIRDKIAASKKKGLWMGGNVPLGYDVRDRKLIVNEAEAKTVRMVFARYLELGSVHALRDDLNEQGIVGKAWTTAAGRRIGGRSLARGALYELLRNPIYRGEIRHGDKRYPGQHGAIIDQELWDRVQARLTENVVDRRNGVGAKEPSLLAGLLYDEAGDRMVPTHATKKGKRYRYYVSKPLVTGGKDPSTKSYRVPAADIERIVVNRLRRFFADGTAVLDAVQGQVTEPADHERVLLQARELAEGWRQLSSAEVRHMLVAIVGRTVVRADQVSIGVLPSRVASLMVGGLNDGSPASVRPDRDRLVTLSVPARLRRAGMDVRLVIGGPDPYADRPEPDNTLVRLILRAQRFRERVMNNEGQSLEVIAAGEGVGASYFTRVLRLGWLPPSFVCAILEGTQPAEMTAAKLLRSSSGLPQVW